MILNSVHNIDFDRYHKVRDGKLMGRGCGKTVTKMVMMLVAAGDAVLNTHKDSSFLYVGENHRHVMDIKDNFQFWLQEADFNLTATYRDSIEGECNGVKFKFRFIHAFENMPCSIRGYRFDEIFTDLTYNTSYKYWREVDELPLYKL